MKSLFCGKYFRIHAALGLVGVVFAGTACSPGALFGEHVDKQVRDGNYRTINTACADISLPSSWIDVATFRQLVKCLNANDAMPESAALVESLADSELDPVVIALNRYLLSDQWLFKLEATYNTLERKKLLVETLTQLGRILENKDFITSSIALLKDGYVADRGVRKRDVLKVISQLSGKLTNDRISEGLDLGINVSRAKAFQALQVRFERSSSRPLQDITEPLLKYIKRPIHPRKDFGEVEVVREVLQAFVDGQLDPVMDQLLPLEPKALAREIPRLSAVLRVALNDNASVLDGLSGVVRDFRNPVACIQSTAAMSHTPEYLFRQLAVRPSSSASTFINREILTDLVLAVPFCEFSEEAKTGFNGLVKFASTRAMEPLSDVVGAFYKGYSAEPGSTPPLVDLFVRFLGDRGNGRADGIQLLLPALAELADRDVWADSFLLATVLKSGPGQDLRERLKDAARYLILPQSELGNKSPYDVLIGSMARMHGQKLEDFIRSLDFFVRTHDPLLAPALSSLRSAFHSNDVHPGFDVLRQIMADAPGNEALFDTLFLISDRPEFGRAIQEISAMARPTDGRLKDLLFSLVSLFHKFASRGEVPVSEFDIPAIPNRVRHNWEAGDLPEFSLKRSDKSDECLKVDLGFSLASCRRSSEKCDQQLEALSRCLNHDGHHGDAAAAIQFLKNTTTEDGNRFLLMPIDWISGMTFAKDEIQVLTESILRTVNDGRASRFIRAYPLFVNQPPETDGPALRPLLDLATPLVTSVENRMSLRRLQAFGSDVLRRSDFLSLLRFGDTLWNTTPTPSPTPTHSYDVDRIARWVGNKECGSLPEDPVQSQLQQFVRAQEIIDESERAIANTAAPVSMEGVLPKYEVRRSWGKEEFKSALKPVLDRLADPEKGDAALKATLRFMRYFTLPEGKRPDQSRHYHSSYLQKWLQERAKDYRLISVVYPADAVHPAQRRVRWVNQIDRLELLLMSADIYFEALDTSLNSLFLERIGLAWGDVPFEDRPIEIQERFPKGSKGPKTLRATVTELMNAAERFNQMVDFPALPVCQQQGDPSEVQDPHSGFEGVPPEQDDAVRQLQAGLYNIQEVISVLEENLPESGTPFAGGLAVLRDLFFELSHPENDDGELSDNLLLANDIVRLGLLRNIGRVLAETDENDPAIKDLFEAIIAGAASDSIEPVASYLLAKDPDQRLVWSAVDQLFDIVSDSSDKNRAKQMGLYALASVIPMTGREGPQALIDPLLSSVDAVLARYSDYLSKHADLLSDVVRSQRVSDLLAAFYQSGMSGDQRQVGRLLIDAVSDVEGQPKRAIDAFSLLVSIDESPQATRAWDLFVDRAEFVTHLPQYQSLGIKDLGREFLDFVEGRDGNPASVRLSQDVLRLVANRLDQGDLEQILLIAHQDPDRLYGALQTLGVYIDNGSADQLLDLVNELIKPSWSY